MVGSGTGSTVRLVVGTGSTVREVVGSVKIEEEVSSGAWVDSGDGTVGDSTSAVLAVGAAASSVLSGRTIVSMLVDEFSSTFNEDCEEGSAESIPLDEGFKGASEVLSVEVPDTAFAASASEDDNDEVKASMMEEVSSKGNEGDASNEG